MTAALKHYLSIYTHRIFMHHISSFFNMGKRESNIEILEKRIFLHS